MCSDLRESAIKSPLTPTASCCSPLHGRQREYRHTAPGDYPGRRKAEPVPALIPRADPEENISQRLLPLATHWAVLETLSQEESRRQSKVTGQACLPVNGGQMPPASVSSWR